MNSFTSLRTTSSKILRSSTSSSSCKLADLKQSPNRNANLNSSKHDYFSYRFYVTTTSLPSRILLSPSTNSPNNNNNKCILDFKNKNNMRQLGSIRSIKLTHNHQKQKEMSESTILLESSSHIDELPIAVSILKSNHLDEKEHNDKEEKPSLTSKVNPTEERALIEGFNSYHSPQEVLRVLDTIPTNEITPLVAYSILKKLLELENNFGFRNEGKSWIVSMENGNHETFARSAIIARLINIIISSDNSTLLLDTLDVLRTERNQQYNFVYLDSIDFMNYRSELSANILGRGTEGLLSLNETCRAVCSFGEIYNSNNNNIKNSSFTTNMNNNTTTNSFKVDKKFIDKFAICLLDKNNEVNINNIVEIFRTIPYFTKSQRLVCNVIEKKLKSLWWRLDADTIAQICDIIGTGKQNENRFGWCITGQILTILSRCLSMNMHAVTEEQLVRILKCFGNQAFCDPSVEKSLNKYMKAKCSKIQNSELIQTVVDYCTTFRLRSSDILTSVADYVVQHEGKNLSSPQITSIISGFGHLNFHPPNDKVKFWSIIEELLEDQFVRFPPKDMINILLACTYLEKFPLNFSTRIFSPYFLDRINASEANYDELQHVRRKLKLLDAALNLECGNKYNGPFLSKDFSAQSLSPDGRIFRSVRLIRDSLETFLTETCTIDHSIILPTLPLNELYIVDIMVVPMKGSESQVFNYVRNRVSLAREKCTTQNDVVCILITLPEHLSSDGTTLIGPQAMRIRHLKTLGFKVATIKYDFLSQLRPHPAMLKDCLKNILLSVEFPVL